MGKLNTTILEKIKLILSNKHLSIPESNVELVEAMRYLDYLLSSTQDLNALEKALIRFFRIRPKHFNDISSPISSIYNELIKFEIFPDAPQTSEEKLLSEFLDTLFTSPLAKKKNGDYQELDKIDPEDRGASNIYKTVANVEPGIKTLSQKLSFDWNDTSFFTGYTRLHAAIYSNDLARVTLLLAAGADPNAEAAFDGTPLDLALSKSPVSLDIIKQLNNCHVKRVSVEQINQLMRFLVLDMHKKTELIKALLPIHALKLAHCTDKAGSTLLHHAAINGNEEIATILLDNYADAEKQNHVSNTPLSIIAGRSEEKRNPGLLNIAKMLLNKMSAQSVNTKTQDNLTALEWSFNNRHKEAAVLLLGYKSIDISTFVLNGHNVLTSAIMNEWIDVVEQILSLEEGRKLIHQSDAKGFSPLHRAALNGNIKATEMLLNNGANANATNNAQNTPLSIIAGREKNQQMPEHVAIAKMLLSKMSPESVNAKTQDGRTALGWAVNNLNPEIVLLLIQFDGINLTELFNGETIKEVAENNEWTQVTSMLEAIHPQRDPPVSKVEILENQVMELSKVAILENQVMELSKQVSDLSAIVKNQEADIAMLKQQLGIASSVGVFFTPLRSGSSTPTALAEDKVKRTSPSNTKH
jgi:ankyrin repeat protein